MKIAENGEMEWVRKIPKKQKGEAVPGTMSHQHFGFQNDQIFLYIDNESNLNLASDEAPEVHLDGVGGYFAVCKINDQGDKSKDHLFNVEDKDVEMYPAKFNRVSSSTLVGNTVIKGRGDRRLVKIEYRPR